MRHRDICIIFAVIAIFALTLTAAHPMDHGFDPNDPRTQWMETKKQPDIGTSCCGKGDGYFVDRYAMNRDGSYDVWIEDSGMVLFPDGTVRPRIQDKHFHVPREKVNPLEDDLDNPFDHSVIWLRVTETGSYTVYCFIRHPQGY